MVKTALLKQLIYTEDWQVNTNLALISPVYPLLYIKFKSNIIFKWLDIQLIGT